MILLHKLQDEDKSKHWVDMPSGANGRALANLVRTKLAIPTADSFVLEYSNKKINVRKGLVCLLSTFVAAVSLE